MKLIPLLLLTIAFSLPAIGQVINNDADSAIYLLPEKEYKSKTDHCTVQWDCVDESLTGKCVEYHNDQWFYFNSGNSSETYVNIYNQSCRDLRGVQLIVLKGIPCKTETYEVLTCVSTATQDNVHTKLENLEKNQDYWVIIDGYLHDFCQFTIRIGEHPKGFSVDKTLDLENNQLSDNSIFSLQWKTNDSLARKITGFKIFRKKSKDFKYQRNLTDIVIQRDAYGRFQHHYSYSDTVRDPGYYQYLLSAVDSDGAVYKINEYELHVKEPPEYRIFPEPVVLKLRYPEGTPVTIKVFDEEDQLIEQQSFDFNPNQHYKIKLDKLVYLERGIKHIRVLIEDVKSETKEEYFFKLAEKVE